MSIRVMTRDTEALPDDLLTPAKEHMRVDHSEDNNFIKSCIARAIANIEQRNEVTIAPTTVMWKPRASAFVVDRASVPVLPVSSFVAFDTAEPPEDVSANYEMVLKWDSIHGIPIQTMIGPGLDMSVTLTCGYTVDTLPPAILDLIMRHAAHLYEHRELLLPGREYVSPDLASDLSWWKPRA